MQIGAGGRLRDATAARLIAAKGFVDGRGAADFDADDDDDDELAARVVEQHRLELVVVAWEDRDFGAREEGFDMSGDYRYSSAGRKVTVPGLALMLEVPFTGDRVLLTHSAGRAYEGLEADVAATHDAILAYYSTLDRDPAEFDRWWSRLEGMLVETVEWANAEAEVFNTRLGEFVVGQIAARRDRQRRNKDFIRRVGLERRDDALVLAPVVRRAVMLPTRTGDSRGATPRFLLDSAVFDGILDTLSSMGLAFERSPATFSRLREEELRDFMLVALNATWQGDAVGEAFNAKGHTDILIRRNDSNVFVAELKIWDGPKTVDDAVTQLLGYLGHRDARAALVVFVRGRADQTAAVRDAFAAVGAHSAVTGGPEVRDDLRQDFVLTPPQNPERPVSLAVLVFVVPDTTSARGSAGNRTKPPAG